LLIAAGADGQTNITGAAGAGVAAAAARKTTGKAAKTAKTPALGAASGSAGKVGDSTVSQGVDTTSLVPSQTVSGAAFDYNDLIRRSTTTKGVGGAMKGAKKKGKEKEKKKHRRKTETGKGSSRLYNEKFYCTKIKSTLH